MMKQKSWDKIVARKKLKYSLAIFESNYFLEINLESGSIILEEIDSKCLIKIDEFLLKVII